MGRRPCCWKVGLKKGAWSTLEDSILTNFINTHGAANWRDLPKKAGLERCGKSCRLRWFNYLRPDIKRGDISPDEDELIIRLHNLLGNRWSLIAGRLPGRTDNEIKNHWKSKIRHKLKDADRIIGHENHNNNSRVIRTRAVRLNKVINIPYPPDPDDQDRDQDKDENQNQNQNMSRVEEDEIKFLDNGGQLLIDFDDICFEDLFGSGGHGHQDSSPQDQDGVNNTASASGGGSEMVDANAIEASMVNYWMNSSWKQNSSVHESDESIIGALDLNDYWLYYATSNINQ